MALEDFDKIFKGIYNWIVEPKCFHDGVQLNKKFEVGDVVTGGTSGAVETITSVHSKYFKYTKVSAMDFARNEQITSDNGTTSYVKWVNDLKTSISTRIYLNESPEEQLKTVCPYIIYFYEDGIKTKTYNTEYKNMQFQWTIFDNNNSSSNIIDLYEKLETLLRYGRYMTVEGHSVLGSIVEDEPVFTRDENKIWRCILTSRLFIEKN